MINLNTRYESNTLGKIGMSLTLVPLMVLALISMSKLSHISNSQTIININKVLTIILCISTVLLLRKLFEDELISVREYFFGYKLLNSGKHAIVIGKSKRTNEVTLLIHLIYKVVLDKELVNKLVYDGVLKIKGYKLPDNYDKHSIDKDDARIKNSITKLKLIGKLIEVVVNKDGDKVYAYNSIDTTTIIIPYSVSKIHLGWTDWADISKENNFRNKIKLIGGNGLISLHGAIPQIPDMDTLDISELDTSNIVFWYLGFKAVNAKHIIGLDKLNTKKMKSAKRIFYAVHSDDIDLRGLEVPKKLSIKEIIYACAFEEVNIDKKFKKHKGARKAFRDTNIHKIVKS